MFEELFVGIASASQNQYGVCVCVDSGGQGVGFTRFSWSPKGLATLLERVRREAADVVVGIEAGGWDRDMALALVRSSVTAKLLHPGAIDALAARIRYKRNALHTRVTCMALLLLATDYPIKPVDPEQLAASRARAVKADWRIGCQQRLMANVQKSVALAVGQAR